MQIGPGAADTYLTLKHLILPKKPLARALGAVLRCAHMAFAIWRSLYAWRAPAWCRRCVWRILKKKVHLKIISCENGVV